MKHLTILSILLLLFVGGVYAEWTLIAESVEDDKHYVELETIKEFDFGEAGLPLLKIFQNKVIYKDEQTSRGGYKYKSAVSTATVNCDTYSQTEMYLLFYKDSMEEELIEAFDGLGIELPRDYPPTGSVGRLVLEFVCSYKLKDELKDND